MSYSIALSVKLSNCSFKCLCVCFSNLKKTLLHLITSKPLWPLRTHNCMSYFIQSIVVQLCKHIEFRHRSPHLCTLTLYPVQDLFLDHTLRSKIHYFCRETFNVTSLPTLSEMEKENEEKKWERDADTHKHTPQNYSLEKWELGQKMSWTISENPILWDKRKHPW